MNTLNLTPNKGETGVMIDHTVEINPMVLLTSPQSEECVILYDWGHNPKIRGWYSKRKRVRKKARRKGWERLKVMKLRGMRDEDN